MNLEGKTALVTGAGSGIGRAIALRLAADGADAAIADIDRPKAESTADEIQTAGRQARSCVLDVSDPSACVETVESIVSEWGHIDILVNNAGVAFSGPVLEFDEERWRRMFDINLHGAIRLCKLCGQHMVKQKSGKIVNIASEAAKTVRPSMALYAASKVGLIAITRGLSQELAQYGINVNAVCPGIVHTEMWDKLDADMTARDGLQPGTILEQRRQTVPIGRLATPEDIAGVVSFLVSEDASYITGQALNVTGGREQH